MSVIELDQPVVTVVNVFTVEPGNQQPLTDLLVDATRTVIRTMPGFVSANFHQSLDGTKVVNYAQWRSVEDFEAMHAHPDCQEHFVQARAISKPQMAIYKVSYIEPTPVSATA
jgi:heme-degrading monooxygenase HmoA